MEETKQIEKTNGGKGHEKQDEVTHLRAQLAAAEAAKVAAEKEAKEAKEAKDRALAHKTREKGTRKKLVIPKPWDDPRWVGSHVTQGPNKGKWQDGFKKRPLNIGLLASVARLVIAEAKFDTGPGPKMFRGVPQTGNKCPPRYAFASVFEGELSKVISITPDISATADAAGLEIERALDGFTITNREYNIRGTHLLVWVAALMISNGDESAARKLMNEFTWLDAYDASDFPHTTANTYDPPGSGPAIGEIPRPWDDPLLQEVEDHTEMNAALLGAVCRIGTRTESEKIRAMHIFAFKALVAKLMKDEGIAEAQAQEKARKLMEDGFAWLDEDGDEQDADDEPGDETDPRTPGEEDDAETEAETEEETEEESEEELAASERDRVKREAISRAGEEPEA